jgi:hypothetical protein
MAADIMGIDTLTVRDVWTAVGLPPLEKHIEPSVSDIDFGIIGFGVTDTQWVELINQGRDTTEVYVMDLDNTHFTAPVTLPLAIAPNATAKFAVTFAPTGYPAENGTLTILSDAIDNPVITIALAGSGALIGAYHSEKPIVAINVIPYEGMWRGDVIRMLGNTFNWFNQSECKRGIRHAPHGGRIDIRYTGSRSVPIVSVPCTLTVPQAGRLVVSPIKVDFGSIPAKTVKTATLTLSNPGNMPTTISGVTVAAPFGCVLPTPLVIAPRGCATATVRFAPAKKGAFSGALNIASNAAEGATLAVPLKGTGR